MTTTDKVWFQLGSSSQSLKTIYMHQSYIDTNSITAYIGDSTSSGSATQCYTGGSEGIVTCEGTGKYLTLYNSGGGGFKLGEMFAWDESLVVFGYDDCTFVASGLW